MCVRVSIIMCIHLYMCVIWDTGETGTEHKGMEQIHNIFELLQRCRLSK